MQKFTLSVTLSVGLALAGCAAPISFPAVSETTSTSVKPAFEPGDLVLRLRVGDSRTLQAGGSPVSVYDVQDVAKLEISAFVKVGDAFAPMSTTGKPTTEEAADRLKVTTSDRHQTTFVFKNLPHDQTYRFVARAYDAQNHQISQDAGSSVEVVFAQYEYPYTPTLQLKLKDKPFQGTAKAHVTFSDAPVGTHRILLDLYKKGTPNVKVGTPVEIAFGALGSGRSVALGGLAPETTYILEAKAYASDGVTAVGGGSVEWTVGSDQELGQQTLAIARFVVTTYAGQSTSGHVNGSAPDARFNAPVALAKRGDYVYVADMSNHRIRRIDANGAVTTWVGDGTATNTAGNGTSASIHEPAGLVFDSTGNLFVASYRGNRILKITPDGDVSLFAGNGAIGYLDGTGTAASFHYPIGLCMDASDNLYVADAYSHRIRKITPAGVVSTFAGSGAPVSVDGTGTSASINRPSGLAIDGAGTLYVAEYAGARIRTISAQGVVSTLAGAAGSGFQDGLLPSARFSQPAAITRAADGALYVSDANRLRRIKDGVVSTVAGSDAGFEEGAAAQAKFNSPFGSVLLSSDTLLVADLVNHRIRRVLLPSSSDN